MKRKRRIAKKEGRVEMGRSKRRPEKRTEWWRRPEKFKKLERRSEEVTANIGTRDVLRIHPVINWSCLRTHNQCSEPHFPQ